MNEICVVGGTIIVISIYLMNNSVLGAMEREMKAANGLWDTDMGL